MPILLAFLGKIYAFAQRQNQGGGCNKLVKSVRN
jgi:hypothetical protein